MGSADGTGASESAPAPDVRDARSVVRTSLVTGAAIVVPVLVTVIVVWFAASLISDAIRPFVLALSWVPGTSQNAVLLELLTIAVLVVAIGIVGYVSAYRSADLGIDDRFDAFVQSLPGIGAVYRSFDRMSTLLLDSDTESFQEVVLVEYPTDGSYVVAFRTSEPPEVVHAATGHDEMVTLFVPMAPNPVMGGFVLHVSRDRVVDVDLTVEEGVQSIVTSGVALADVEREPTGERGGVEASGPPARDPATDRGRD